MIILYIILAILGIFSIASNITLIITGDVKYYKKVYNLLPLMEFYSNVTQVYGYLPGSNAKSPIHDFIWFYQRNDFLLVEGHYIHNTFYTYLCPYSLYWLIKYKLWCKKNIDITKIPKWLL